ncbi:hypothetical protein IE53DRAFT_33605 [Violaceomyces palustris]|uniref:Uncharacterized protein n=1 Tax=Violaceomyces palustris TaxID=1673888 RepID=A0ACD0P1E9_9BASI|nr:hypothetical protein IE53DRAFT_33605 [Violaceomyces palustris]
MNSLVQYSDDEDESVKIDQARRNESVTEVARSQPLATAALPLAPPAIAGTNAAHGKESSPPLASANPPSFASGNDRPGTTVVSASSLQRSNADSSNNRLDFIDRGEGSSEARMISPISEGTRTGSAGFEWLITEEEIASEEDIRTLELLAPPPRASDGDVAWGLGQEPTQGWDKNLEEKLAKFHALKKQGTHFNTSLSRNQAFKNPHIYAKLVEFVEIDEKGSNYQDMTVRGTWNPKDRKLGDEALAA